MFTEDLSTFFDVSGMAQTATVGGVQVSVIFDNGYAAGNVGMLGMAGAQPAITLPTAQVPGNPLGGTVTIGATSYLVAAHEPDGTGISRLLLEATA